MTDYVKKYYYGAKESFPEDLQPGAIYFSKDEDCFYIDTDKARNRINVQKDWNEQDEDSPRYIKNKPVFGTAAEKDIATSLDDIDKIVPSYLIDNALRSVSQGIDWLSGPKSKRYGVKGIGQEASGLTRLYDSVGMVAEVGTDGDNSNVRNDFDKAYPFMRRKCVGNWTVANGRAKFNVQAYLGDDDYTEDGTKGDYVAVECPLCYYYFDKDKGELSISGVRYDGYRPFDIFCHEHDVNDTMDKFYAPAYFMGMKDGHAVSLPGLDDTQGRYKILVDSAKTYNGSASTYAMISPAAWFFYQWALFTVEFATQNSQSIMRGCSSLNNDYVEGKFIDASHFLAPYTSAKKAGQYLAIGGHTSPTYVGYQASHKAISVTRCDAEGTPDNNDTYALIEVEDLGKEYLDYAVGNTYKIYSRPYPTGYCNGVSTPSGSPVSNSDGYHPCKYRWIENPWGNHYNTCADLFNIREGTADNDYYLEWYYCIKPWEYVPATNYDPQEEDLTGEGFEKLSISTPHAKYSNGYIVSKKNDETYADIYIPDSVGGTISTYYCDYTSLVYTDKVRVAHYGGAMHNGDIAGISMISAFTAPNNHTCIWGTGLFFAQ